MSLEFFKNMNRLLLSNDYLRPSDQTRRHVFTLGEYMNQTPYAFTQGADHFFEGAEALGFFSGQYNTECFVANLDDRKLNEVDAIAAHLAIDLDSDGAARDDVPGPGPLTEELAAAVQRLCNLNGPPRVVLVGCQPADKGHAWSIHAHFPELRPMQVPPQSFLDAINSLPAVLAYGVKADKSIYTNGIRFGPTSKPLRPGWRAELPRLLTPGATWREAFPLHDLDNWARIELTWPEEQLRGPIRRSAQGAAVDVGEDPLLMAALTVYRTYVDVNASLQPTGRVDLDGGKVRMHFRDSPSCRCQHRGNNHYAVADPRARTLTVFCGGGGELYGTYQLPPLPREDDYEERLLAWLKDVEYTTVATPFTAEEYATLVRLPTHPLARPPDRPRVLCIETGVFNRLQELGASQGVLCRYVNLAVTFNSETALWHIKNSLGHVVAVKDTVVSEALASFTVPGKKDKPVPFFRVCRAMTAFSSCASLPNYRAGDPRGKDRVLIVKRIPPALDAALPHMDEVRLWWTTYLRVLTYNSVHATDTSVDMHELLIDFLHCWVCEVLFGYRPVGIAVVLVEPLGGAGKTLLFNVMRAILGVHESHTFTDMSKFLAEGFNSDYVTRRLFAFDDGSLGTGSVTALKNFITQHMASANYKWGRNGVQLEFAGALLYPTNRFQLPSDATTGRERRMVITSPHQCYEQLLEDMEHSLRQDHLRLFGEDHASFLGWGYQNLAGMEVTPEARALSAYLYQSYQERLRDYAVSDLTSVLRAAVESQQMLTTVRQDAVVAGLGPLGCWIVDCVEQGYFMDLERSPGKRGAKIELYQGPHTCETPNGVVMPAILSPGMLRTLFLASLASTSTGLAPSETSSDSEFRKVFIRTFNALYNGQELATQESRAHRVIPCSYKESLGQMTGYWSADSGEEKQRRGLIRISFPLSGGVEQMDLE